MEERTLPSGEVQTGNRLPTQGETPATTGEGGGAVSGTSSDDGGAGSDAGDSGSNQPSDDNADSPDGRNR